MECDRRAPIRGGTLRPFGAKRTSLAVGIEEFRDLAEPCCVMAFLLEGNSPGTRHRIGMARYRSRAVRPESYPSSPRNPARSSDPSEVEPVTS